VAKTTRKNCSCFAGSSPRVVFRIDYRFWKIFFNGSRKYQVLKRLEGSYRVHLWKKKSSQEDITVDQNKCTDCWHRNTVYWKFGPVF